MICILECHLEKTQSILRKYRIFKFLKYNPYFYFLKLKDISISIIKTNHIIVGCNVPKFGRSVELLIEQVIVLMGPLLSFGLYGSTDYIVL